MLILELTKTSSLPDAQTNVAPFVYGMYPGRHTTADYWINEFGCPDESTISAIFVSAVIESAVIFYAVMLSLADCEEQESSFYFLVLTELLYVHYTHEVNRWTAELDYGDQLSYNDKKDIYIDDVYCAALVASVPSIAQQQDVQNYDKIAMKNGNAVFKNVSDPMTMVGRLDDMITRKLYGNDAHLYYLAERPNVYDYHRNELVDLSSFTIDDYDITLQEVSVALADKRAAQEILLPFDKFTAADYPDIDEKYVDKVIPFGYGLIRSSAAIPTNSGAGAGVAVVYRQAVTMTVVGTVQVKVDEAWVTVVPTAVDLVTGEFTVAAVDARNASDVPYECRVLNSVLVRNDYASDCIVDINQRFLGILFNESSYDVTEWEAEQTALCTIGIIWDKQIKLYEAIAQIQNGANVGFRYEINAAGRRTIRIDDNDREATRHVQNIDIQNVTEIPVVSRKDLLASSVLVQYALDYVDDVYLEYENDDNEDYVLFSYRQTKKQIVLETALTTEADAIARAAWHAERFRDPPKICSIELRGSDYYNVRIYDTMTVELTPSEDVDATNARIWSGRRYYGFWKVKVLSIDPKVGSITNVITAQLVKEIEQIDYLRATPAGAIRSCGRDGTAVCLRGVRDGS